MVSIGPLKPSILVVYCFVDETIMDNNDPGKVGELEATGYMLHEIEFVLEKDNSEDKNRFFTLFNALDANGLSNTDYPAHT